ncbi:hypothetical protein [Arsenicibacter rosenii]|uniref:3-keto-disaccharide hydrolase domain-containing protein n=1 Tax=Arsenicibacter rosenii TaxID=1750698 RepID=A0A1S2VNQ2_9BACT|nr:hypothetical protein [Arsenicibacter rosenii]OIN59418.1 hypothetical protein BLX24_10630 [Arsenicibacter rosenii]
MKYNSLFRIAGLLFFSPTLFAQKIRLETTNLIPNQATFSFVALSGKKALRVVKDSTVEKVDEPTFIRIKGITFTNGTIEVKVLSRLLKTAPSLARGFIGVAFRINDDNTRYESIYLRPTNARADDQVRRNHSIQYYSYPDYKFDRLRKEAPERYESYTDMTLNAWITIKIVVKGQQARLFVNDSQQPSLLVNDLKLGSDVSGGIALWVDVGTEGYFSDLTIKE